MTQILKQVVLGGRASTASAKMVVMVGGAGWTRGATTFRTWKSRLEGREVVLCGRQVPGLKIGDELVECLGGGDGGIS